MTFRNGIDVKHTAQVFVRRTGPLKKMVKFVLIVGLMVVCCYSVAAEIPPPVLAIDPTPPPSHPKGCIRRNAYIPVEAECDAYVECKDFMPVQMTCPDGLHYDPRVEWPNYPCGYPMDVQCVGRNLPQVAKPNPDCPHRYGYFPSPVAAPNDCGQYRFCLDGKPIEMECPTGLAFNPDSGRCDWPGLVKSCNVEAYLGYTCPPATYDESGDPIVTNHRYKGSCYAFYSCQGGGHPRLLSCDAGFAFDEATGRCKDADKVRCQDNASASVPALE
ncbi:unnamed protein product [Pieris brassicae]|uniref:Chitin-binding type-2 domain-containing protein n=1 Tax=Pieris brassicae TaxID=7116 RepID=A0A9P0T8Y4_PIEBR|nr:unnamed protein product [Pieris brassicae]